MPQRKKSDRLKLVSGTYRPDRSSPNAPVHPEITPKHAPPAYVRSPTAKRLWRHLLPILCASRCMTAADVTALAHLCNLHAEVVDADSAGRAVKATTRALLRLCLGDFGLSPASRPRIQTEPGVGGGGRSARSREHFSF
jgi:phage terminase small subunit